MRLHAKYNYSSTPKSNHEPLDISGYNKHKPKLKPDEVPSDKDDVVLAVPMPNPNPIDGVVVETVEAANGKPPNENPDAADEEAAKHPKHNLATQKVWCTPTLQNVR